MNPERLMTVLRAPYISEKTTVVADKYNQYAFKVLPSATKTEIKAAVELMFNVKVKSVTVINVQGKTKRFKQTQGKRSDWKKAFVSLNGDQKIDFAQAQ